MKPSAILRALSYNNEITPSQAIFITILTAHQDF